MHALIRTTDCVCPAAPAAERAFCSPPYDSTSEGSSLRLDIYLPGVRPSGIEITTHGADLSVVARKDRGVRVNWHALQLEPVCPDYRLNLRLGHRFNYPALRAEFLDGILTLRLPHRASGVTDAAPSSFHAA